MLTKEDEHLYGGKLFRPRPLWVELPPEGLSVLISIWGPDSAAEEIEGLVRSAVHSLMPDEDEKPVSTLDLSVLLERIHTSVQESFEGNVGIEILALQHLESLLNWISCGQPSLILLHQGRSLILNQSLDSNFDCSERPISSPLPGALLGADQELPPLTTGSVRLQKDMKFIAIARSWIPAEAIGFLSSKEECVKVLAADQEDAPFWWCSLSVD